MATAPEMEIFSASIFSDAMPLLELPDPREKKGLELGLKHGESETVSHSIDRNDNSHARGWFCCFRGGWRTSVAIGVMVATIILLLNIGVLIWVHIRLNPDESGVATAYEGSCDRTATISAWSHLAINIISTLLLGANNVGMQCLSAPTRAEVDLAHSQGSWLSIGVPSLRNLKSITPIRIVVWCVLGLSSIPLHLL